jgi:hypothetical protein
MRPYYTILKDSFREALASRVLLVMLGFSTLLLLAIAPISLEERSAAFLSRSDIDNPDAFAVFLRTTAEAKDPKGQPKPSPAARVWSRLDSSVRNELSKLPMVQSDDDYPHWVLRRLADEINDVLTDATLYDAAAWSGTKIGQEATELIDRGIDDLGEQEVTRLNRLLLEAAFPKNISRSVGTDLYIGYLAYEYAQPISLGMSRRTIVAQFLATFTDWFLGFLGVFVAILVTASIIPHMFEPGAVDLLLSKPVARPLLFLSKFAGGCAFVAVLGAYLIVGLWLIVGLRFDWWHHRLLWCIPLLLFLFAIYYGVSALTGLYWRNTIICVVTVIMFWFVCVVIGSVKGGFDVFAMEPTRIQTIVPAGDTLLVQTRSSATHTWDNEGRWNRIFNDGSDFGGMAYLMMPSPVVPVYDPKEDRLITVDHADSSASFSPRQVLAVAQKKDDWNKVNGPDLPAGMSKLFVRADGRILAAGPSGVYQLAAPADRPTPRFELGKFSVSIPFLNEPFARVSPEDYRSVQVVAMDGATGTIVTWDGSTLATLGPDDKQRYTWQQRKQFAAKAASEERVLQIASLAIAGSTIVAGESDGTIHVYDAQTLERRSEFPSRGADGVQQIAASPDGRYFAAVFHDRRLWIYDAQQDAEARLPVSHQGDISAAAFLDGDRLAVAHSYNTISEYSIESAERIERLSPELSTAEWAYWYLIKPLYTVFPKPSELKNLVQYVLTGKETAEFADDGDRQNPNAHFKLDVWGPLWSNAAFLAVMLALGCLYVYRREF